MASALNPRPMDRPIRVVVFGGAYFEPAALRFIMLLDQHPDVHLAGVICQSSGQSALARVRNLLGRRGIAAIPVLAYETGRAIWLAARQPIAGVHFRRQARAVMQKVESVRDVHAPTALERVRALVPDLGVLYGGPILRPELFEIPAFGTLGIHHGKLPQYRGKKTTFWAMYNGERSAGVTIQKINAGLDTGEIVREGDVVIGTQGYRAVESAVEQLGLDLYIDAILAIRRGDAVLQPQRTGRYPLYRQPGPRDIARFVRRRVGAVQSAARTSS